MAVSFVAYTSAEGDSATPTVNVPAGGSVGDVYVAIIACKNNGGIAGDNETWTEIYDAAPAGASQVWMGYRVDDAGEGATFTFTSENNDWAVICALYTGVDTDTPVADSDSSTGSTGTAVCPTVTAVADGSMAVWLPADTDDDADTFTTVNGDTKRHQIDNAADFSIAVFDEPVNTGATGTRSYAGINGSDWAAGSILLNAAAGGETREFESTAAAVVALGAAALVALNKFLSTSSAVTVVDTATLLAQLDFNSISAGVTTLSASDLLVARLLLSTSAAITELSEATLINLAAFSSSADAVTNLSVSDLLVTRLLLSSSNSVLTLSGSNLLVSRLLESISDSVTELSAANIIATYLFSSAANVVTELSAASLGVLIEFASLAAVVTSLNAATWYSTQINDITTSRLLDKTYNTIAKKLVLEGTKATDKTYKKLTKNMSYPLTTKDIDRAYVYNKQYPLTTKDMSKIYKALNIKT